MQPNEQELIRIAMQDTHDNILEAQLWHEIRKTAKTNKALQNALNECVLIYKLIKHDNSK